MRIKKGAVLLASAGLGLACIAPGWAQVNVPLTIQEILYQGAPTSGIARGQDPVTVGIPLSDSAGITSIDQLGLSGAAAGQFRILGTWPSGHAKWVLVDTQADMPAGGTNTSIAFVNGSGNFGGSNLATDNGATITVNTGPGQFIIKKANFNLFDSVVVNGKILVASGSSKGLVITGPDPTLAFPNNVSCPPQLSGASPCTTEFFSGNDPASTAVIEENGPVRAVVKADGSHVDAGGHVYMHYTVRLHFYKGKSYAKAQVILRNADESTTGNDYNSAFKGFASYEARVTPNLGAGKTYNISTDQTSSVSGAFSGTENAYLYQAYSNNMEISDWNQPNCDGQEGGRCTQSYISRTSAAPYTYSQDGYEVIHGASILASGDHTKYPQGWADLADATGAGIEVGVYQLSAYWPKALQLMSGGSEIRVGIWPDQKLFQGTCNDASSIPCAIAYYQEWPGYSVHDIFFEFHDAGLASPSNDFLKLQHYLVARAPRTQYNTPGVFFYPIIDPVAEDSYYQSISFSQRLTDVTPRIFRTYDWPGAGGGNQHDFGLSYLHNFLQRGMTGRYLYASHFYRMIVEQSFARSDGFRWRDVLGKNTFPPYASTNGGWATRHFVDSQHAHWYGLNDLYFMTGDETVKDQLLDGVKDYLLNAQSSDYNGGLFATRDVGHRLMGFARTYQSLSAFNDPDAAGLVSVAQQVLNDQVFPELKLSGFGTSAMGTSRPRGVQIDHSSGCQGVVCGLIGNGFQMALLLEGMWEWNQMMGPSWPNFKFMNDLMTGGARWSLGEAYGWPSGQAPSVSNTGFIYEVFVDTANALNGFYAGPGVTDTNWFNFFIPTAESGDMSWKQRFAWYLLRSNGGGMEFGSHMEQAVIDRILNTPAQALVNVPVKTTSNGGGSYTLSWTVPIGASSYRIKYATKTVVDWIGFDPGNNTFIGDPAKTWPWFAIGGEVANPPSPGAPGTTQSYTASGLDASQPWNFAVKAWVSGAGATDTVPPTVSISSPAAGSVVSGITAIFATASDNIGVGEVWFLIDGIAQRQISFSQPYRLQWNSLQVPNGTHTLSAMAIDTSGNTTTSSPVSVTVNNAPDTTPPSVNISEPLDGALVTSGHTVGFTGGASDNVGVSTVTYSIDGGGFVPATGPYYRWAASATLPNGPHTFTAKATDLAGNTATATISITVNAPGGSTIPPASPLGFRFQ